MNSGPRNSMKIRMTAVGVFFLVLTVVIAVSAVHSELPLMHLPPAGRFMSITPIGTIEPAATNHRGCAWNGSPREKRPTIR